MPLAVPSRRSLSLPPALWRWAWLCLMLLCGLLAQAAWAQGGQSGATAGLQKVRVQLKWTHQFQFAGFYAAIEQGYFRQAGLDVELIEGGPMIDPAHVVSAGQAEFGIGSSSLLIHFNQGKPVVAVAAILQHSPFVIMARTGPDLRSVRDLEGKRLMSEAHSDELLAYLAKAGVNPERVQMRPHTGSVFSLQASGFPGADEVDAMTAYTSTEPFVATRHHIPYQIFNPRDVQINFYGDTLFTSRDFANAHPQAVAAMRDALVAGWRHALAHQSETVDLILRRYAPKMDATALSFEALATYQLFQTDVVDIGYMSRERWQQIGETYASTGLMPKNFSLDGFLFSTEDSLPLWAHRALIWGGLAIVLGGLLAAYIARLNWRLSASLKTLGAQAEKLEAMNNELARLSTTDALTGLFNRRYFDDTLARECKRASRTGSPLSMLMVDIDHFKKYNDSLGHPAGDACLRQVAEVLHEHAQRAGEFAARIGGEEFAVVASHLSAAQATELAEHIVNDLAARRLPHPGAATAYVTVSIGVATLAGVGVDITPQHLTALADEALYRAKAAGRNRWEAA